MSPNPPPGASLAGVESSIVAMVSPLVTAEAAAYTPPPTPQVPETEGIRDAIV
jgi:hypothetical protein